MNKNNDIYKDWSVVFVEPHYSLNVGYVARVIANFGLKELIIVHREIKTGQNKIRSKEAIKYASHGRHILESARVVRSLYDVRKEKGMLVATTAITAYGKSIIRKWVPPENLPRIIGKRKDVAIVLGRDTTGLTNEELMLCNLVAHIPTWSNYQTLNVSHALAILLYSIASGYAKLKEKHFRVEYPSPSEIKALEKWVEAAANKLGYDPTRKNRVILAIRRLVSGPQAGRQEVRALMGLIRRLTLGLNKPGK